MLAEDTDGSVALRLKVKGWTEGKKGNIRALLSTLQDVLWEGTEWEPISIADLLKSVQVKKAFMRACLIVHPDKITGDEHEPLARLIFDELNKAYNGVWVVCVVCPPYLKSALPLHYAFFDSSTFFAKISESYKCVIGASPALTREKLLPPFSVALVSTLDTLSHRH